MSHTRRNSACAPCLPREEEEKKQSRSARLIAANFPRGQRPFQLTDHYLPVRGHWANGTRGGRVSKLEAKGWADLSLSAAKRSSSLLRLFPGDRCWEERRGTGGIVSKRQSAPNLMSVFDRPPRLPEEDPYSLPGAVPRQQPQPPRESKPPKLPPRDLPRPDYEDVDTPMVRPPPSANRKKNGSYYDDPYYCGFRARVPNFAKRGQEDGHHAVSGPMSSAPMPRSHSQNYLSLFNKGPERSIYDSAYGSCSTVTHHAPSGGGGGFSGGSGGSSGDDDYSKIYGRIGRGGPSGPSSAAYNQLPREVYVGEWE
ncbi:hypothetical protein MTO96_011369 [Rhipicephalus appendiculatus]